jgi:1-acyl-sn-glycerol-3-phosphate acyltransferase
MGKDIILVVLVYHSGIQSSPANMKPEKLLLNSEITPQMEYPGAPLWLRRLSQPVLRWLLLKLARYQVTIEGELPEDPSLLLAYPHGEHANSILLPSKDITYVAARDTFFKTQAQQTLLSFVLNTLPISRDEDFTRERFEQEVAAMQAAVEHQDHHLLVYPQGTRRGLATDAEELQCQLKPGIHLIAKKVGIPVVPVGIVYEDGYDPRKGGTDVWRETKKGLRHGRRPPQREVRVRIGEPLEVENRNRKEFLAQLAQQLYQLAHPEDRDLR